MHAALSEIISRPMLLLRISVKAPTTPSNSIGMFTFLKNVSFRLFPHQSFAVPSPAPAVQFMS